MSNKHDDQSLGIWRALFDFAQQVGANDPVNNSSNFRTMSGEDRKWLEEAMNAYTSQADPVRLMKGNIKMLLDLDLNNPNNEDRQKGLQAIESLKDLCDDFDNAADFHKISGFRILVPLLASSCSPFRANAAELIGNISQNHAYCQQKLSESKILRVLMELVDKDTDSQVKTKALYAISCMIRSNDKIQSEFIKEDGLTYLLRAASSIDQKLQVKTLFLLSDLLRKNEEWKRMALDMGMVDQLVSMLGTLNNGGREHVTSALLSLISDFPRGVEECRKSNLCLKNLLECRIEETEGKSELADERDNCTKLLDACWPKNENSEKYLSPTL